MSMLIGLTGYGRSGKNSVADILTDEFGYTQRAFADPLKRLLRKADPTVAAWVTCDCPQAWESARKDITIGRILRRKMQDFGAAMREEMGEHVWIDTLARSMPQSKNIVISDVRTEAEENFVRERGGVIWWVDREGVGPANDDATETFRPSFMDKNISNDGTLEDLRETVCELL